MARHRPTHLGIPGSGHSVSDAGAAAGRSTVADRYVARKLLELTGMPLTLVLWDGETISCPGGSVTRVRFHDRGALWKLALNPDLNFGDLYSAGRVTVDGELLAVLEAVYLALAAQPRREPLRRLAYRLFSSAPSLGRSRANIHHHYDLGNAFYELWLDREAMQYTCAYYPSPDVMLEQAQRAKMDHVCRKLWLRPDETVVEAGCGWGGFALHMARAYGVKVRAFNISHEQIAYARERAEREGLADRVEYVEDDYRNITGRYDVFVSVGMLEHVGRGNYRELGELIDRSLPPQGRGLLHTIGRDRSQPLNPWIRKRIFPGSDPPTLRDMTAIFEPAGFSILDVENLRLHYARTLREWLARFEEHSGRVRQMFDDRFLRAWRLYLAGSAAAFTTGSLQLFQVLFARTGGNELPWTRAHVYSAEGTGGDPS